MISRITIILLSLFSLNLSPARAETPELEEVAELLKKIHDDQCQRHSLRGRVMVAHRAHDQKTLDELYPKLETLTKKIKPDEERIKALQAAISGDSAAQDRLESIQVELGACD